MWINFFESYPLGLLVGKPSVYHRFMHFILFIPYATSSCQGADSSLVKLIPYGTANFETASQPATRSSNPSKKTAVVHKALRLSNNQDIIGILVPLSVNVLQILSLLPPDFFLAWAGGRKVDAWRRGKKRGTVTCSTRRYATSFTRSPEGEFSCLLIARRSTLSQMY